MRILPGLADLGIRVVIGIAHGGESAQSRRCHADLGGLVVEPAFLPLTLLDATTGIALAGRAAQLIHEIAGEPAAALHSDPLVFRLAGYRVPKLARAGVPLQSLGIAIFVSQHAARVVTLRHIHRAISRPAPGCIGKLRVFVGLHATSPSGIPSRLVATAKFLRLIELFPALVRRAITGCRHRGSDTGPCETNRRAIPLRPSAHRLGGTLGCIRHGRKLAQTLA